MADLDSLTSLPAEFRNDLGDRRRQRNSRLRAEPQGGGGENGSGHAAQRGHDRRVAGGGFFGSVDTLQKYLVALLCVHADPAV